jgi:mersacidin/lichenicidin family type 2 lantibiotic
MSQENIIRAWKDAEFRDRLSEVEKGLLPEHPAGLVQLDDEQLGIVAGALPPTEVPTDNCTWGICVPITGFPWC